MNILLGYIIGAYNNSNKAVRQILLYCISEQASIFSQQTSEIERNYLPKSLFLHKIVHFTSFEQGNGTPRLASQNRLSSRSNVDACLCIIQIYRFINKFIF